MNKLTIAIILIMAFAGSLTASISISKQNEFTNVTSYGTNKRTKSNKPEFTKRSTTNLQYYTSYDGIETIVADYGNGYVVVTILNGAYAGKQGAFENQNLLCWSTAWRYEGDHYVHTHIDGYVYTYANKQVMYIRN